jgi:hypothetical protein
LASIQFFPIESIVAFARRQEDLLAFKRIVLEVSKHIALIHNSILTRLYLGCPR